MMRMKRIIITAKDIHVGGKVSIKVNIDSMKVDMTNVIRLCMQLRVIAAINTTIRKRHFSKNIQKENGDVAADVKCSKES